VSWRSTTQTSVALFPCEAELIATCEATKSVMWTQQFLKTYVPRSRGRRQSRFTIATNHRRVRCTACPSNRQ
jgi:hypothetical protein